MLTEFLVLKIKMKDLVKEYNEQVDSVLLLLHASFHVKGNALYN